MSSITEMQNEIQNLKRISQKINDEELVRTINTHLGKMEKYLLKIKEIIRMPCHKEGCESINTVECDKCAKYACFRIDGYSPHGFVCKKCKQTLCSDHYYGSNFCQECKPYQGDFY